MEEDVEDGLLGMLLNGCGESSETENSVVMLVLLFQSQISCGNSSVSNTLEQSSSELKA